MPHTAATATRQHHARDEQRCQARPRLAGDHNELDSARRHVMSGPISLVDRQALAYPPTPLRVLFATTDHYRNRPRIPKTNANKRHHLRTTENPV